MKKIGKKVSHPGKYILHLDEREIGKAWALNLNYGASETSVNINQELLYCSTLAAFTHVCWIIN